MSSSSGPTIQQTEVVNLVAPIIAALVTLFRLAERMRQRRLWFDDAWAALALVFNVIQSVTGYLYLRYYAQYSQETNIVLFYVILQFFTATIWASRISILFTIVRLTTPFGVLRRWLMVIFVAFLLTWGMLVAQSIWICESEPSWQSQPRPQCNLGISVAIAQVITDVVGDALLIIIPCQMVYRIRLNRSQKIRVITIFSASAITTAVCLVHDYYVFTGGQLQEGITAFIETSIGLIVANLSVVVAFLFRIGTEETAAFAPGEPNSIITVGSQSIRKRAQRGSHLSAVIGIEITTIMLDDLGEVRVEPGDDRRTDTMAEIPAKAVLLPAECSER